MALAASAAGKIRDCCLPVKGDAARVPYYLIIGRTGAAAPHQTILSWPILPHKWHPTKKNASRPYIVLCIYTNISTQNFSTTATTNLTAIALHAPPHDENVWR